MKVPLPIRMLLAWDPEALLHLGSPRRRGRGPAVRTKHDDKRLLRAEERRAKKRAKRRAHEGEQLAAFFAALPWLVGG